MKWIHTSDLHIGKQLNEISLLEDQRFFLNELCDLAKAEKPDVLLIAGDLYDRSVPSAEAVELLNGFLTRMVLELHIPVLAIAGNHDSPQRLDFCRDLLKGAGLYLVGSYEKRFTKITFEDAYGPVHFFLSPFLEPALVRLDFPDLPIHSYDDAFRVVMKENEPFIDYSQRNVLLTHGFFSYLKDPDSVARSASEVSLGGSDLIDARYLESFDYAALGHIHRPQSTGAPHLCYSGSPLKYSLSEAGLEKSVVVAELREKGNLSICRKNLPLLRDLRILSGSFDDIVSRLPDLGEENDLVFFSLTDTSLPPMAMNRLRNIYPNALGLSTTRQEKTGELSLSAQQMARPMADIFEEFYQAITGDALQAEEKEMIQNTCHQLEKRGETDEADSAGI